MVKVSRPLNQSPVQPSPAVRVAPTTSPRPQGYQSGQAALSPKKKPQSAADDLRHQQACTSANVTVGRNQYLMERGGLMRVARAYGQAPELAHRRDLACSPHVSPDTAVLLASLSKQMVAPEERSYEKGQAEDRKEAADAIKTAQTVGKVADAAGTVAEVFLPGAVGLTRSMLGRCAEEIFTGDGQCSLGDMAEAGAMNLAGDTAKKVGGKAFGHFAPERAAKIKAGLDARGLKFGGGEQ